MTIDEEARATVEDLYAVPGQAELIGGKIVRYPPFGYKPGRIIGRICLSLDRHAETTRRGNAFTSTLAYIVSILPSGRESFSPDASYYFGPLPLNPMHFIQGPPTFAAEARSEYDYGPAAEIEMAEKRADYFLAGTKVVWDVDPVAECIHVYRASEPTKPMTYCRGQTAEAEPAVPGWRVPVDWLFG